jgi:hypothetical protein
MLRHYSSILFFLLNKKRIYIYTKRRNKNDIIKNKGRFYKRLYNIQKKNKKKIKKIYKKFYIYIFGNLKKTTLIFVISLF